MLLYVLHSAGSSPGRQGYFMAVNARNEMMGSIGGGMMEHKFVELAKERLSKDDLAEAIIKKQVHDKSAGKEQSGMICSGEQTAFMHRLTHNDVETINKILNAFDSREQGMLVIDPSGIHFESKIPSRRYAFEKSSEAVWRYEEHIGHRERIHIIGGGHCALALSRLMRMLGFCVYVYEDRPGLNTLEQNEWADKKIIVDGYEGLAKEIDNVPEDYIVIMTFGYRTDDIALRALLHRNFKYLGLLGSKKKIEKMFTDYRVEGWSEQKLASIHAPVGLNIKSETPEEIAVSIAAEIIKIKNNADQDR
ncbi:MAG: XdhC family protein [Chitinophagaceae bacterium]|nr:XdhC family protein [Chitinophagaceae bacterium]